MEIPLAGIDVARPQWQAGRQQAGSLHDIQVAKEVAWASSSSHVGFVWIQLGPVRIRCCYGKRSRLFTDGLCRRSPAGPVETPRTTPQMSSGDKHHRRAVHREFPSARRIEFRMQEPKIEWRPLRLRPSHPRGWQSPLLGDVL